MAKKNLSNIMRQKKTPPIVKSEVGEKERIAEELMIEPRQIVAYSQTKPKPEAGRLCVFRKKLGIWIVYDPKK